MIFTQEQIKEIKERLKELGSKDTQFPLASSLEGDEIISLVQEGENRRMSISQFWDYLSAYLDEGGIYSKFIARYGADIEDLQNQIDSIEAAGIAVSNEFGNNEHISISQKSLTESRNSLQAQIDAIVRGDASTSFSISPVVAFVGSSVNVTAVASCGSSANISIAKEGSPAETQVNVKTFTKTFSGITTDTDFIAGFVVSGVEKPNESASIVFVRPISYGYYKDGTDNLTELTTPKLSPSGQYTINIQEDASKIVFKVPSSMNINNVATVGDMNFPIAMENPVTEGNYKLYRSVATFDSGEYVFSVS